MPKDQYNFQITTGPDYTARCKECNCQLFIGDQSRVMRKRAGANEFGRLYPVQEAVYADLNGPAFKAYYCLECVMRLTGECP